jgi:hypothetical protein
MDEIWKPVKGYEGQYEVSSLGRVKSLSRKYYRKSGALLRTQPEKILKQKTTKHGYKASSLNSTYYLTHRLVAIAFLPIIDRKTQVNHIDCNKINNVVFNLEWCNHSENQNHAYLNGLRKMKLNKKQYGEILLDKKSGLTLTKIAVKYGVSKQRISQICADFEIVMDRIPADLAPDGWDVFPKLDAQGCIILKRVE